MIPQEPESPNPSEDRQQLARDRTEWAMERTIFARERTLSAWLRTALTAVAAGVAVAKLIEFPGMPSLVPIVSALFLAAALVLFAMAFWRYREGYHKLRQKGIRLLPLWGIGLLVGILMLGSVAAFLLLFPRR